MKNFLFILGCLLALLSLVVFSALYGSRHWKVLDVAGLCVRHALHYPIRTRTNSSTASPDGRYQLTIVTRQWTWKDVHDMSTYELIGRRDGAPILGGANLAVWGDARMLLNHTASWLSGRAVTFRPLLPVSGSLVPLMVENKTSRTLGSVVIAASQQSEHTVHSSFIFDLASGARESLDCLVSPGRTALGCWVESGKRSAFLQIPAQPVPPIQGIIVTLLEGQAPAIELVPSSANRKTDGSSQRRNDVLTNSSGLRGSDAGQGSSLPPTQIPPPTAPRLRPL
jgi:hypothetical protein